MPSRCVAANCSQQDRFLFLFPDPNKPKLSEDERRKVRELRRQWVLFVKAKRADWEPSSTSVLCAHHFTPDCILNMDQYTAGYSKRLMRTEWAVPTLHLTNEEPEQTPSRPRGAFKKRENRRLALEAKAQLGCSQTPAAAATMPAETGMELQPHTLKGHLRTHLLIHSGKKPHVCNICSMAFVRKSNLNRHLLSHSIKTDLVSSLDREEELPSTSEESENLNSYSQLSDTSENAHDHKHPGNHEIKEEIVHIVEDDLNISNERKREPDVGEVLTRSDAVSLEMSFDVKKENTSYEMSDIVKEEHDIDYE